MLLVFTDECGTSFGLREDGLYQDGDFYLYGGIPVSPLKYIELERLFTLINKDYFGIRSRFDKEIHAGQIFHRLGDFCGLDRSTVTRYFSEVVQILAKFDIPLLAGVSFKRNQYSPYQVPGVEWQMSVATSAVNGFLQLCEHYLAQRDSTGIIVADAFKDLEMIDKTFDKRSFLTDEDLVTKKGIRSDLLVRRLFYDVQKWRIDPDRPLLPLVKQRYPHEKMASFLIDNVHYIDSRYSPMNQFVDVMIFLFSRILQKSRITASSVYSGIEYEVPLDANSMAMMIDKCRFAVEVEQDVMLSDLSRFAHKFGFSSLEYHILDDMKAHNPDPKFPKNLFAGLLAWQRKLGVE